MKIETLTEKITNGKFSAVVDYASDIVSVDIGDGSEPFAISFCAVDGLADFLGIVKERVG
ncbi:hypothetical protein H8S45_15280 [Agathobaculum sp. NSJ-28]|uniref:Uncharacterized protein n=1 Tax=Agathobaculum faecis TaxID=2763013 RepID=A0A923LZA3_9FIRM|nr:hypothetical protein [Agathobaculum faecis]MBC5726805.1 hypothetical protein [Agathobaculum faecis]